MESFNIPVMMKDGSLQDFEVKIHKDDRKFEVCQDGSTLACFAPDNGQWKTLENPGNIDEDMQQRITQQLNGISL